MKESISLYEKEQKLALELSNIDLCNLTTYNKSEVGRQSGLIGENKVYLILLDYCKNVYKDVVLWNKKRTFTTEIDFICEINGYLLFVEVKEWHGDLFFLSGDNINKVELKYYNLNGALKIQQRTNPLYTVGGFVKDFSTFIKQTSVQFSKKSIIKLVVFSRDDISFHNTEIFDTTTNIIRISELRDFLNKISNLESQSDILLPEKMPSWDNAHSMKHGFHYSLILNESIMVEGLILQINEIHSIVFENDFVKKSLIRLKNGNVIIGYVDRTLIKLISGIYLSSTDIDYIEINGPVHKY